MSKAGFNQFNQAFPVAVDGLYAICLALFLHPFLRGNQKWKAAVVFVVHLLISLVWGCFAAPQGTFTLAVTALLVILSRFLGLKRSMAFLLGLLFWNAKISSALTVESLYFIVERLVPQPVGSPEAVYFRAVILLMMLFVSHSILLGFMLVFLQRQLKKRAITLHQQEIIYLSFIPTVGILFGQIISNLLVEVKDGIFLELYDRHPAFLAVVPALALLFYLGACLSIFSQQSMEALRREWEALFAERQQIQAIRDRIQEMERFYAQIRGLKHEMRGHLTSLKGLASTGDYDSLVDYIGKIDNSISNFDMTFQTGNPVTDVIMSDAQRQSKDLGIHFQADFHYPIAGGYDAFDVGIILQNLLKNALEGCKKAGESTRFITISGKKKGRFFLIEVQNSLMGEVIFGQDGLPVSTKTEEASMHGIGLANVRRVAEKYMGGLEIKAENQKFDIVVLLQENLQGG